MYFFNQVWSAVFDHFACYPVISWTFVVLQFFHGLLYFFYQYITLAVSKWWRDVFQLFDKVIGYLLVKLCALLAELWRGV